MIEFIKAHKIGTSVVSALTVVVMALCVGGFVKRNTIKGYLNRTTVNELADGQENKGGYVYDKNTNQPVLNGKGGFVKISDEVVDKEKDEK